MLSIVVTDDVLNGDRSMDVRPEQSANISYIVVTFDVSNGDRSKDVRPEHP
jgi:hypothetical protein